jgi:TPR repeat protein
LDNDHISWFVFKERRNPPIGPAAEFEVAGLNHPISVSKGRREGFIAAQYLVGLAHLQGVGVEKNGSAAYY